MIESFDSGDHIYSVLEPDAAMEWLSAVASEYVSLRMHFVVPIETNITLDGIENYSSAALRIRIRGAVIPTRRASALEVVRSDFGEVISYMLLEEQYGTRFGYKSVRDRETIQLTGRGIDVVGVEEGNVLKLVLGEVKVSGESRSPPEVVDRRDRDSLRNQHTDHIHNLQSTEKKVWDLARRAQDSSVRDLLMTAAVCLQYESWERLQIIACSVLVRPRSEYTQADFGSFRSSPNDYSPAHIRFLIVCIPDEVDTVIDEWYARVQNTEISA